MVRKRVRRPAPRSVRRDTRAMIGLATAAVTCIVAVPVANAAGPPPGRAYEMVSPVDGGAVAGVSTEAFPLPGRASGDGDRLVYGAGSVVGGSTNGPVNPLIFGHRTATGWVSRSAIRSIDDGNTPLELSAHEIRTGWLTAAGDEMTFSLARHLGNVPSVPSSDPFGTLYRSTDTDAAPEWLSAPPVGATPIFGVGNMATAADDTRVVALNSTAPLTTDGPTVGTAAVYVRRNGAWQLGSRLPGGALPAQDAYLANSFGTDASHGAADAPSVAMRNQLAGNGRFLLFMTGGNVSNAPLYVRDLDTNVTHQLAGGGSGAANNANQLSALWGDAGSSIAAPDNTVVPGIVAGAENGPYAYFQTRPVDMSTDSFLSQANLETGVVTPRPELDGPPLGVSADGRRVLFLRPPASGDAIGDWTLRYWDMANPGTSVALGTVAAAASNPYGVIRVYRSQQDGQSWIFTSQGNLDPARPNQAPTDTQQLYRWKVGDTHPSCLTCEPLDGVARTTGVSLTTQESLSTERFTLPTTPILPSDNYNKDKLGQPGHSISDDGRWLLFDSPDQLVAEDTNGVRDVYLWDRDAAPDDQLQLVTSGVGPSPSYAIDLDPTGKTAFFTTRDGLVPADRNGSYDVYAARIGGGFPASEESCVAEGCRPPVLIPPAKDPILSNLITAPSSGPQQAVQKGTPKLRVRALRTTSRWLTVRVDTPKAGRIVVSGARVKSTKRTAKRAATYTLKVPLNATAQRLVARGRTVKVGLRVQFTPTGAKKASRVSTSVSIKKGR